MLQLLDDNPNLHYDSLTILDLALGAMMDQARLLADARTESLRLGTPSERGDVSMHSDALAYIKSRKRRAEKKPSHATMASDSAIGGRSATRNQCNTNRRVHKLLRSKNRGVRNIRGGNYTRRT
jgi:hypothetical protein